MVWFIFGILALIIGGIVTVYQGMENGKGAATIAGIVTAVGEKVKNLKIGDNVIEIHIPEGESLTTEKCKESINLAKGKTINDLDYEVMSNMEIDTLLEIVDAIDNYQMKLYIYVNGKLKRQGKTQGYTSDYKKAYVTLTADSKAIEFFESLS